MRDSTPRCRAALVATLATAAGVAWHPAVATAAPAFDLVAAVASATAGSRLVVPAGTYPCRLIIDRPLTLEADGTVIIDGGDAGDIMTITAPDVTVRGFHLRGTGTSLDRENAGITIVAPRAIIENNTLDDVLFGIYLKEAAGSVLRGNTIGGKALAVQRRGDGIRVWRSDGVLIENNHVRDSRDVVIWFSAGVTVRGNRIERGRYGLHFMYSHANVIEANHLMANSVGAFLMYSKDLTLRGNVFARNRGPSGYGVGLKDMDGTAVDANFFIGNRVGLHLDNSPSSMRIHDDVRGNVFAFNDIGVAFLPAVKRNRFSGNAFHDNLEQVAVLGGGTFEGNEFTPDGVGNYWSDYRGFDLDGDGDGDVPYVAQSFFEDLMTREPKLRLFLYSPGQQALELAARALPVVAPRPKLTDASPLMRPRAIDPPGMPPPAPRAMAACAAALLLGAAGTLVGGLRPTRAAAGPEPSS